MSEDPHAVPAGPSPRAGDETPFSEDGVDLTLIRWMLSLSPGERLRILEQNIHSLERLRRAGTRT